MKVEFECIVCGRTDYASVQEEGIEGKDRPLETLHQCPNCEMETIWIET